MDAEDSELVTKLLERKKLVLVLLAKLEVAVDDATLAIVLVEAIKLELGSDEATQDEVSGAELLPKLSVDDSTEVLITLLSEPELRIIEDEEYAKELTELNKEEVADHTSDEEEEAKLTPDETVELLMTRLEVVVELKVEDTSDEVADDA